MIKETILDLMLFAVGVVMIPVGIKMMATGRLGRGGGAVIVMGGAFAVLAIARWRYRKRHPEGRGVGR